MNFKNLLIATLFCGIFLAAAAPAHAQKRTNLRDIYNKLQTHPTEGLRTQSGLNDFPRQFKGVSPQPAQSTAEIQSRLIALSMYYFDGVMLIPSDSIRFNYSEAHHNNELWPLTLNQFIYYPDFQPYLPKMDEDIHFQADSLSVYYWDAGDDIFVNVHKVVSEFDASGNIVSQINSQFNGTNWGNTYRLLYNLNSQGYYTSIIEQEWTGTVWQNYGKREFTYDSQNNLTEWSSWDWNNSASSWSGIERRVATYEGNNMSSFIMQDGGGSEWINYWRTSMIYEGNNPVEVINEIWNASNWEPAYKTVYTYNSSNKIANYKEMSWDIDDFENDYRVTYTYDEQGLPLNLIDQYWDSGSWAYDYRETYEHTDGALSRITAGEWDGSAFEDFVRINFQNNAYAQVTTTGLEEFDGDNWVPSTYFGSINFFYEEYDDAAVGVADAIKNENISIYPNPASDFINVKLNDQNISYIKIVDITGKVVFETKSNFNASEVRIPVNQLPNGVYVLHLKNGNQSGAKKFVVRH